MDNTKQNAVLRFYRNGALQFDLNDGGQYQLEGEYIPALPESMEGESAATDTVTYYLVGSTLDQILDRHIPVNRALREARDYGLRPETGNYWEVETQGASGTYVARAMVLDGNSKLEPGSTAFRHMGDRLMLKATLTLTRTPFWERTEASVTATTSPSDNGANNYAVLPSIPGELPAALRLRLTGASGNIANCQRVLAALRANGNPANFIHQLQVGETLSGYTVTLDATKSALANDNNFLSHNVAQGRHFRYTPTATTWLVLATWTITANFADQFGRFFATVRCRDNSAAGSTTTNFYVRFRSGILTGATAIYGPYWNGVAGTKVLYADSGATTELTLQDMGQGTVPAGGIGYRATGGIVYELSVRAVAASGTFDVDYVSLWPMGEAGNGKGMIMADFPVVINTNRAYLDARLRQEPAYLTDGSDVLQAFATNYDTLGEILAWPNASGQRIYFALFRDAAGYLRHDHVTGITLVPFSSSRYLHMAGTI